MQQIPPGFVLSYGDVATGIGYPGYARHIGRALRGTSSSKQIPWHRVVNGQGVICVTGNAAEEQRRRLIAEGVEFRQSGAVNMRACRWVPKTNIRTTTRQSKSHSQPDKINKPA